jgi:sugar/nucleoside kinase (ribokinase family)
VATRPRLLCIGDLNADIAITGEVTAGSDTAGTVELAAGGSAANVAAGVARTDVSTRFVGVVGDDLLGTFLIDELGGHGVEVQPIRRAGVSSRAIAALVGVTGDRSMVSDLSTATVLTAADVDAEWFDGVGWLHLTAYSWFPEGGPEAFASLIKLAEERSIPWSVDPSSAQMLATGRSVGAALKAFTGSAVIFPSEDEAEVLTGLSDPVAAAQRLLDIADTAVVTRGPDGAVLARRDQTTLSAPAHEAIVVNALGCGDAFAAGFIASRLLARDDEASMDAGLAAAARVVEISTAR